MRLVSVFVTIGIALISPTAAIHAVKFPDGSVSFDNSPRLVKTTTTLSNVRVWGAKYYFTIELPQDVGEPLQQVSIQQRQGEEEIRFHLEETTAFQGTTTDKGQPLSIEKVTRDEKTNMITIVFSEPIPVDTTFTLRLVPRQNPMYGGTYLFGVSAFPSGEKPNGLYLGAGRLQFYDGSDRLVD